MLRIARIAVRSLAATALVLVAGCSGEYGRWVRGVSDCPGPDCRPRCSSWGDYSAWTSGTTCGCRPASCARPCAQPCGACASPCGAPGVRHYGPPTFVPAPRPVVVSQPPAVPTPAAKSLYERIGGMPAVEAFVDEFIARLVKNPVIMANPKVSEFVEKGAGEGAQRRDAAHLRRMLIDQICEAAGGPCKYTGRDMKTTHTGLGITEAEWNAGAADLVGTLDKLGVKGRERDEIVAFVVATKKDIVEKP
jgi:hemoglobin